jgi:hypothetical protein
MFRSEINSRREINSLKQFLKAITKLFSSYKTSKSLKLTATASKILMKLLIMMKEVTEVIH